MGRQRPQVGAGAAAQIHQARGGFARQMGDGGVAHDCVAGAVIGGLAQGEPGGGKSSHGFAPAME